MSGKKQAAYGSWPSPVTAEAIATAKIRLSELRADSGSIYWLESRPQEGGRGALMRRAPDGAVEECGPPSMSVRSSVHEYGGGAYAVLDGALFVCSYEDQRIYRVEPGGEVLALTEKSSRRYADLCVDRLHSRVVCIEEDHSGDGEPISSLVAVDDSGSGEVATLVRGADFYSSPTLSPDGRRLAWLSWQHPDMPWDRTQLWVAEIGTDGTLGVALQVAGDVEESILQPAFSPTGELWFSSDRSGYWNLHRWQGGDPGDVEAMTKLDAEVGGPQWVFGTSVYAFSGSRVVFAANHLGEWRLYALEEQQVHALPCPWTEIHYLRSEGSTAFFLAASRRERPSVAAVDLDSGEAETLHRPSLLEIEAAFVSEPRVIEFPSTEGATSFGFFYPPCNAEMEGPRGEKPPLLVLSHGGPTAAASSALSPEIQFWTSRGIAVVDVNYRGSSGFGRAYRTSLDGNWGVFDVDDCVAAAEFLAQRGEIDPDRVMIRGGSAGGYTTLAALAFRDVFKAGASYYGIGDLGDLARDTHKFESRYVERLVGPYPEMEALYRQRSPRYAADRLSCPIIFFQGLEDRVVPPNQAEVMVESLRTKGVAVAYVPFPGEQHGFRRSENIQRALECELYFYSRVLGFEIPGRAPELQVFNLEP